MQSRLTALRKPREQGSPGTAQAGLGSDEGGSRLLHRGGKWSVGDSGAGSECPGNELTVPMCGLGSGFQQ